MSKKGPQRYPPQKRYSGLLYKGNSASPREYQWEGRAGFIVPEVLVDQFPLRILHVGEVRRDGIIIKKLTFGHAAGDHYPCFYVTHKGDYTLTRNGYIEKVRRLHSTMTVVLHEHQEVPKNVKLTDVHILPHSQNPSARETFFPKEVVVKQGHGVCWINQDDAPHTVFSGTSTNIKTWGDLWKSPLIMQGGRFMLAFPEKGEFEYSCVAHDWMKGKVIVI